MGRSSRPTVFVGSSTPALEIARSVERALEGVADIIVWDSAFDPGTWLLGGILKQAQQSDFGVFVINADETRTVTGPHGRGKFASVRENVLFEAGIFMGAIGPERTILLWPSRLRGKKMRLPSDLEGLLRVDYTAARSPKKRPDLRNAMAKIRRQISGMGRALRSGYNEIATLKQELQDRELEFANADPYPLGAIVRRAARRRRSPWTAKTSVQVLTKAIERDYGPSTVDTVFWWLTVYGVIRFDNVESWSSDGSWWYKDSVKFTEFTDRGVVLLNDFRANAT